jgi:hypothetical protein
MMIEERTLRITPLYSGEISIFVLTETNILSGTNMLTH